MEEEIQQGYGSTDQMMQPGPADAELMQEPMEEEGGDQGGEVEAMIAEGVQAFMESQDPEIAVQVVMMLAETMGLTGGGQGDPAGAPPAGDPMPQGAPMARNGGKFGWFGNEGMASEFQKFVTK